MSSHQDPGNKKDTAPTTASQSSSENLIYDRHEESSQEYSARLTSILDEDLRRAQSTRRFGVLVACSFALGMLILTIYFARYLREFDKLQQEVRDFQKISRGLLGEHDDTILRLSEREQEVEVLIESVLETVEEAVSTQYLELSRRAVEKYIRRSPLSPIDKRALKIAENDQGVAPQEKMLARATAALDSGEIEVALGLLDAVELLEIPSVKRLLLRGRAHDVLLELNEADAAFTEALEGDLSVGRLGPAAYASRCLVRARLGASAAKRGENEEAQSQLQAALEDCLKSIERDRQYWAGHQYGGIVYFLISEDGGDDKALEAWDFAAELRGANSEAGRAWALENKSLVYLRNGNWEAARDLTSEVHGLANALSWNQFFRWVALDKLGEATEARIAEGRWKRFRSSRDRKVLKLYLPEEFASYLDKVD